MSKNPEIKERDPRVSRPFSVRINDDISAKKPRWDIVMAKDISASGILFHYDHYLEPGTRVQFIIALPFCGQVKCEGEVIRNVMGTSRGFCRTEPAVCAIAAVFRDIAEEHTQAMREFFGREQAALEASNPSSPFPEPEGGFPPRAKRIERQYITRIQQEGHEKWELVPVQNISSSGIKLNYSDPLEIGAELSFQITLPFLLFPVSCHGKIVRVEDQTRPGALVKVFGIGVIFSSLDETLCQQLDDYADQVGFE